MSALPTLHQDFEQLSFDAVNNGPERTEAFTSINFQLNQHQVAKLRGKVDTGAQSNIFPLRTYHKIYPQNLDSSGYPTSTKPSSTTLTAYNGTRIPQHGTLTMQCQFENSPWEQCLFYVAETNGPIIFGLPTCTTLGIVTMNCVISKGTQPSTQSMNTLEDLKANFPDRFTGLGKFATSQRLILHDDSTPIRHPPRRAPIQLRDKIKAELERMESLGVIRPVTEPTDWVSSITYVQKK